jgi:hypothetical protein
MSTETTDEVRALLDEFKDRAGVKEDEGFSVS